MHKLIMLLLWLRAGYFSSHLSHHLNAHAWLLLLVLGVLNTTFAVTLYLRSRHLIKAQEAAVLTYFEPASAVGFRCLLLAQQPTLATIAGGLLILSAGYVVASRTGGLPKD